MQFFSVSDIWLHVLSPNIVTSILLQVQFCLLNLVKSLTDYDRGSYKKVFIMLSHDDLSHLLYVKRISCWVGKKFLYFFKTRAQLFNDRIQGIRPSKWTTRPLLVKKLLSLIRKLNIYVSCTVGKITECTFRKYCGLVCLKHFLIWKPFGIVWKTKGKIEFW